ncbi:MAG: S9 family peptidase [Terriglobia bacterium]
MRIDSIASFFLAILLAAEIAAAQAPKQPLTLDAFFNSVDIGPIRISPDGQEVVIPTERADWTHSRFRSDLWLYRPAADGNGSLIALTRSGHDRLPAWSPDGHWIAFLSDRESGEVAPPGAPKPKPALQLYLISPAGGEPVALTHGEEAVHAFSWSSDSRFIYYATRIPWTKSQETNYKKEWHDVIQYRKSERGDVINRVAIAPFATQTPERAPEKPAPLIHLLVASTPFRVAQLTPSLDGRWLAFATEPRSQRQDTMKPYGIYLVDLTSHQTRQLLHKDAIPERLHWAPDSQRIFFVVNSGSVDGPYEDVQPRVYWLNASDGHIQRWAAKFTGAINGYTVREGGGLIAAGRFGTEVQMYFQSNPAASFEKLAGLAGTYEDLSSAARSPRIAFVHSTLQEPTEVYLAEDINHLQQAKQITRFNQLFTHLALPQGKPYRWTADDGTTVEGMLLYPPGKFGMKHLPMFTLIHGGPADADGNHFEADWYQWADLATADGWLVFDPNYRGSTGYGDKFTLGIIHKIVSRPGKDILEGIDSLVKAGIADPDHLTVGGYSYGGYMTNWLMTQTTEFKAAVTGAGAVEHVANWGNDDMSYDDAYFLGGSPWQAEQTYNFEAAIWQFGKVTTPTHIVGGGSDIRVYVGEDYLLERALHARGIPSALLIFPGEGHGLRNNPWHGRIKVREELKWLDQYCKH